MVIDKKSFDENGYLVIKQVFTSDEIKKLREEVYQQMEIDRSKNLAYELPELGLTAKFAHGDLLSKELLHRVLLDERILRIARAILANDSLVYFGDSSYQIGTGSNGFHRDNIDRSDLNGPDWQGNYTLVRLGIYLQDHKQHSGGLKVRKGSHKRKSGPAVFVDSEAGDVVIWDLKTLHSGNAVRLKAMPGYSINFAFAERHIPSFLKKEEQLERISMFMTFALRSSHLDHYLNEYTLKRKDTIEHAKKSVYQSEVLAKASEKKLEVMRPVK